MPLFCRHNRLTANCPICSGSLPPSARRPHPARPARVRGSRATGAQRRSPGDRDQARRPRRRRRLPQPARPRPARDRRRRAPRRRARVGGRPPRVPRPAPRGRRGAGAGRGVLARVPARARPARAHELHEAIVASRPSWASDEAPEIAGADPRTIPAYRAWAGAPARRPRRFLGEPTWSPERRFGRAFERLALPGFAARPATSCWSRSAPPGPHDLAADALHIGKLDDATILAAKRLLVSGDAMLLERRAAELAKAAGIRLGALDRGARGVGRGGARRRRATAAIRSALGLCLARSRDARPRRVRIAEAVVTLQRASLSHRGRPARRAHAAALKESPRRLRNARALPGRLRGGASRRRDLVEAHRRHVDIHRLVVHPDRFRRGIAGALLDALEERQPDAQRWVVATGEANGPHAGCYGGTVSGPCRSSSSTARSRSSRTSVARHRHDARRVRAALRTRLTPAAPVHDTLATGAAARRARPWKLLVLACLGARRAVAPVAVGADLRPVRVADLGPRDHPPRPQHGTVRRGSRCRWSSRRCSRPPAMTRRPPVARGGAHRRPAPIAMAYRLARGSAGGRRA